MFREVEYVASAVVTCPPKQAPIHIHSTPILPEQARQNLEMGATLAVLDWPNHRSAKRYISEISFLPY